jgi:hypothetical protein
MAKVKKLIKKSNLKGSDLPSVDLEVSMLQQVIGWSVHCETSGRLGPLFTSHQGKLYYLDTVTMQGYLPVNSEDKAYIDL